MSKDQMKTELCISCKKPATIFQKASGRYMCESCFARYVERSIRKTITKYQIINNDDIIALGVSGGKDSLTMLYNLYQRQSRIRDAEKLIVIHVDEGIGDYRKESKADMIEFLDKYDIDVVLKIYTFKEEFGIDLHEMIARMEDLNIQYNSCTICGIIRRRILNDAAIKLGATKLGIGHNLDDIAQTVILNVIRNDPERIWKNPPAFSKNTLNDNVNSKFIPRIKPLIHLTEEEIIQYCAVKGFKTQTCDCPHSTTDPIFRKRVQLFLNQFDERNNEVKYNLLKVHGKLYELMKDNSSAEFKGNICTNCGYPAGPNRKKCMYCYFKDVFNC